MDIQSTLADMLRPYKPRIAAIAARGKPSEIRAVLAIIAAIESKLRIAAIASRRAIEHSGYTSIDNITDRRAAKLGAARVAGFNPRIVKPNKRHRAIDFNKQATTSKASRKLAALILPKSLTKDLSEYLDSLE